MDTRFLESFVVLVESQSLAEAARKLNITSAALGLRIKALEDEIGLPLVVRGGRYLRPTAGGLKVAAKARVFLTELRDLRNIGADTAVAGELRLGVAASAVAGMLCEILPVARSEYPGLELLITKGSSSDIYRKIANADLDLALIYKPDFELPKSVEWLPLRVEPYVLLARADEDICDPIKLLELRQFIRYDRSLWSGGKVDQYLRTASLSPNELLELDSLEAIAVLVDRGLGVAIVPNWSAPWPRGLSVKKIDLPGSPPDRKLGLMWMKGSGRIDLVDAFRSLASKAVTADFSDSDELH